MDGVVNIPLPGQPIEWDSGPNGQSKSRFVFPCFVAGPENRLAATAVQAMLSHTSRPYNPLVLYGPHGAGKSHLARGIAAQWRLDGARVQCATAASFAGQWADAVETHAVEEFRLGYAGAALLVLEDVQRLADRRPAQIELVGLLDILLGADRQVLVTASECPTHLPGMVPMLRGRLVSGLSVPLSPPGPAARRAILGELAGLLGMKLPKTAARLLAGGPQVDVPELARSLARLQRNTDRGARIDPDVVRRYLGKARRGRQVGPAEIAATTARYFALKPAQLRSGSRCRGVVTARGVAMYLSRQLTGESLQQIGRYFGGRDRTTVMHACRKTERLLKTDPAVAQAVEQLQQRWRAA